MLNFLFDYESYCGYNPVATKYFVANKENPISSIDDKIALRIPNTQDSAFAIFSNHEDLENYLDNELKPREISYSFADETLNSRIVYISNKFADVIGKLISRIDKRSKLLNGQIATVYYFSNGDVGFLDDIDSSYTIYTSYEYLLFCNSNGVGKEYYESMPINLIETYSQHQLTLDKELLDKPSRYSEESLLGIEYWLYKQSCNTNISNYKIEIIAYIIGYIQYNKLGFLLSKDKYLGSLKATDILWESNGGVINLEYMYINACKKMYQYEYSPAFFLGLLLNSSK